MRRWLARNLWFPLQEWTKGHETLRIMADMEAADRLSSAELEQLQRARLREFIESCYRHVPYVRQRMQTAGLVPGDVNDVTDLRPLGVMTKADIRAHRGELRSDVAQRLATFTTGGSTGEPLVFDLGKRRVASRVACRQRVAGWWGLSIGDPEIAIWGSPIELGRQDWIRGLRDRMLGSQLLSAFEMNEARMSQYLDVLEHQGCRQLFGYPSAIHLLCLHAKRQGRNLRRVGVKAVFVTGEVLFAHQRALITEVLNSPVADGYGGRDSGFIAHECPQGGMHVLADTVIVEILDAEGRPVPVGEPGEIVVTDLYSEEAPFIRYGTGDIGIASSRRCQCGRALPLLERIDGRSNDAVVAPDGRLINALALVYPLREIEGIEQYRICQKRVDCFHVQLVCNGAFEKKGEDKIRAGWQQLLRTPLQVTFEYLDRIPADPRGKFRHIVSEVPGAGSLVADSSRA